MEDDRPGTRRSARADTEVHGRPLGFAEGSDSPALHTQPEGHLDRDARVHDCLDAKLHRADERTNPRAWPVLTKRMREFPAMQVQSMCPTLRTQSSVIQRSLFVGYRRTAALGESQPTTSRPPSTSRAPNDISSGSAGFVRCRDPTAKAAVKAPAPHHQVRTSTTTDEIAAPAALQHVIPDPTEETIRSRPCCFPADTLFRHARTRLNISCVQSGLRQSPDTVIARCIRG